MYGLDLFSGIGGLTEALDGYSRPVAYCENDRHATGVLLSRMARGDLPRAPIWDDVKTLTAEMLPPVDIVYGGFPCQDISVAGRGKGLGGERSGLFFEVVRLVSDIRPRFVFLENVAALTFRGAERVVGEFCRLGYDTRWGILSAADVGANHQRERWWLLAHTGHGIGRGLGPTEERNQDAKERGGNHHSPGGPGEQSEDAANTSKHQRDGWGDWVSRWRREPLEALQDARKRGRKKDGVSIPESLLGRVAYGLPFRVDRLRGLGNAVVPAQAREAFERLMGLK